MADTAGAATGDAPRPRFGSVRQVAYDFAEAALDVRALSNDIRIRSAALNQTRYEQASASSMLGTISTSDLRSLVAARKMVQFLGALRPSEYEDVQLLLERAYVLYKLEYEREYQRLAQDGSGSGSGSYSASSTSSQRNMSRTITEDDATLLQAFLTTVLDWVPLNSLRDGLLIDEDDYIEQRLSNPSFEAAHRRFSDESENSTPPPSSLNGGSFRSPTPATTKSSFGRDTVRLKARALMRVLDLSEDEDTQEASADEQLFAMIRSSDEGFLLSIQASAPIRRHSKYLHILTKRCVFLLESSFRLRLMVHYARESPARISPQSRRLSACHAIWKLRSMVRAPSDDQETNELLSGALPINSARKDRNNLRSSRSAGAASLELYEFDALSFHSMLYKRLDDRDVVALMEQELSVTHPEIASLPTRMPLQVPRPPTVHAALEALHRNAPVEGPANANFWRMVARALPNLVGDFRGGMDNGAPFDARQIFQRRPREDFSLGGLIRALVPESVQRAIYNTVVPGAIRILISTPEARGLLPGMLVHTGWLLFKVFILITVLTSRLGIPVPNQHHYRARAQRAAGQNAAGQGQGQAQQNAAGANGANAAARLTTLIGLLQLVDNALAFIGMPDFSTYWQMYSVCLAAAMFILWDMERWFKRRLDSIRREQRRNQRGNNVAGRAVPPPARVAAAGGGEAAGQPGQDTPTPADSTNAGASTDVAATKKPPTAPPLYPPPVYSPRRMTILTRQRRERGQQIRFGLFAAMALGPGPLLKYTLECLAYYGMESEDEELGLILRSQAPFGAILDDSTGLIKSVYHPTMRAQSTRAAQRLRAPARQVRVLYADIEDEHPGAVHRTGRLPLSLMAQQLAQDNQSRWAIMTTLALEIVWRLNLAFILMTISLIPECEILRRRAIDRRTEVWRNARRREIERRAKEAEYREELARYQEEQLADERQTQQNADAPAEREQSSAFMANAKPEATSSAIHTSEGGDDTGTDGIRRRTAGADAGTSGDSAVGGN
ncbi:hypothetical protein OC845_003631 [Tilletia horrida]|nr:hypothetical protein OC845_003631 [Tilletia horrida]